MTRVKPKDHSKRPSHDKKFTDNELRSVAEQLAPALLKVKNVNGVGVSKGAVAVYLEKSSPQVRKDVAVIFARRAPGVPVHFIVLGEVKPQPTRRASRAADSFEKPHQFHDKHGRPVHGNIRSKTGHRP